MTDYVFWVRGQEHADLARLSIASVRKIDKAACFYVYTDDPDATPVIEGTARCVLDSGRPAMVANLDAQILHLLSAKPGQRILFLDADTLLKKTFPFEPEADLTVTWRDHVAISEGEKVSGIAELMPYNYGVVGAIASPRSSEAFIWLRARIVQMALQHQRWYGNQLALAALCGAPEKAGSQRRNLTIPWSYSDVGGTRLSVQYLPCEQWNWSPEKEGEDIAGKGVIHLKGGRKHLMAHYAERAA